MIGKIKNWYEFKKGVEINYYDNAGVEKGRVRKYHDFSQRLKFNEKKDLLNTLEKINEAQRSLEDATREDYKGLDKAKRETIKRSKEIILD